MKCSFSTSKLTGVGGHGVASGLIGEYGSGLLLLLLVWVHWSDPWSDMVGWMNRQPWTRFMEKACIILADSSWTQVGYSKRQEVAELKANLKRLLFNSASICQDRSRFIDVMGAFNKYQREVSENMHTKHIAIICCPVVTP